MTEVFYVSLQYYGSETDTEWHSAHKVDSGEENSPADPVGIRTLNHSITSPTLLPASCPGSLYWLLNKHSGDKTNEAEQHLNYEITTSSTNQKNTYERM